MALVVLTVSLLVIELLKLSQQLASLQGLWAHTLIRLTFVFLMFFSFFRVFGSQYMIALERVPTAERLLTQGERIIAAKLENLLEEEKLYREMGFSRSDLANRLEIAESRLSTIINRHFGCNFNVWVNRKRVAEAQTRLRAEPKTQITVIAFESGFNSIATFNRVFKEIVGISPTEWRAGAVSQND
jgi:AraC-like DNA-binding protein